MDKTLINGIKASKVHIKVGKYIRENIKCGLSLKDIAIIIENKIKDEINFDIKNPLDRGIAFPIGLSLNNCAAHYTPNYNESEIILKEDDIIKIDYGVHIGGTIIDSAFTLHFNEKYNEFIDIFLFISLDLLFLFNFLLNEFAIIGTLLFFENKFLIILIGF